ncbi:T9SS type A sorting domain-containing protein [candidate division KSB1 bacterium]|nr:T9SS type A sorting domain-containing protein [candidate division KSB1 bacterium]
MKLKMRMPVCRHLTLLLIMLFLVLKTAFAYAQQDYFVTDVNQLGLTVWNFGLFGNGYENALKALPSCQYQQFSSIAKQQIEHFSNAGIWIGGLVNGEARVSTAIIDGVFEHGEAGFEFTTESPFEIRSSDENSPYFHHDAVSDLDIIAHFTDTSETVDHNPLAIDVKEEVFCWAHPAAEAFTIVRYTVKNISATLSSEPWTIKNIYLGLWVNSAVGNMNHTSIYIPGGGWNWYDNLNGYDQTVDRNGWSRNIAYQYDADGDAGWAKSYVGVKILGSEYPKKYWNSFYRQWRWFDSGDPDYFMASDDEERYFQLSNSVFQPYPTQTGSWLFLASGGPFGSVLQAPDSSEWMLPPGDSLEVYLCISCAFWADNSADDSVERRHLLQTHTDMAQKIFNGEDLNNNGVLETAEDFDNDGVLDRFILPPYPARNLRAQWNYPNVTLSWDEPEEPVTGYNVYRSQNGSEFTKINSLLIAETMFVDTPITEPGITSYYITSENARGWESTPSNYVKDSSSPPAIDFLSSSNPPGIVDSDLDTATTFPTRTFVWEVDDVDGIETIAKIYYAIDDTNTWEALSGDERSITLTNISPGEHRFFAKAEDMAGMQSNTISFPDPSNPNDPNVWMVKEPVGEILLVNDFAQDQSKHEVQNLYTNMLKNIVGEQGFSVWEIGSASTPVINPQNIIPYSSIDIIATLNYFKKVIWFCHLGSPHLSEANSSLTQFIKDGGMVFITNGNSAIPDTGWTFTSIDSAYTLNPAGRLFSGVKVLFSFPGIELDSTLDLEVGKLIANRISTLIPGPKAEVVYRMEPDSTASVIVPYKGSPIMGIRYRTGKGGSIYFTMPFHYCDGKGNLEHVLRYILTEGFTVGIAPEIARIPASYKLDQNFPNPFNPETEIGFEIPQSQAVEIVIYNMLGQNVLKLVNRYFYAGQYHVTWNGRDYKGNLIPSGIYFYRIKAGSFIEMKKMLLMR